MLIKRIELHNIRSYVQEKVEFGKGLNFLEGDIGAGKSTILMAVKFALFGKSKGLDYTQILREGAKEGSVKLTFVANGKEYMITRKLRRKVVRKMGEVVETIEQEKVVIEDENTRQELSPTEADEKVLKLIGVVGRMGKRAFSKIYEFALYVPQEQMKEILADLKQEREAKKKTISQLFGCEIYGIARENANEVRKMLEREIEIAMARLGENFSEIERRERSLATEIEELREMEMDVERIEKEIEELNQEVERLNARLSHFIELRKEKERLEKEKSGLVGKKEQIAREIERLKAEREKIDGEIEKGKREIEALNPSHEMYLQILQLFEKLKEKKEKAGRIEMQIKERIAREETLKEQIASLESVINGAPELEKKIDGFGDIERELEELEKEKEENTEKISKLRTEIGKLNEEIEGAAKEKDEFTSLAGLQLCPKCRQPLTKEHIARMVMEIEEKVEEKKRLIKEKESEARRINARQVFLESRIKESRKLVKEREKLLQMLEEIERKKSELAEKRKKVEVIEAEIGGLRKEFEAIGFDQEEFAKIEKKLSELAWHEENWKQLKTVLAEKEKQIESLEKRIEEREKNFQDIGAALAEIEKKLVEISYDEQEHAELEKKHREVFGELKARRAAFGERKKQIEEKKKRLAEIEKEIQELKAVKERAERLKAFVVWLEKLGRCYEEIEKNVLREAKYKLEAELQSFFKELLGNPEMEITLDENFTPEVSVGEGYIRPFENLSGGEGTALSLAYRLALNKVITKNFFGDTALLILDEPTDGFSSEQINSLKELLVRIKESYGNGQIFVVSHEQELEGAADTVYEVIQTNNGTKVKMRGVNAGS